MLYSRGLFVPLGGASFPSPNMQYAYMASGSYASTPNETVNLSYHPCFSAVEVKLVKPEIMTSKVRLKEAVLTAGCGSGNVISDAANITMEEAAGLTQKVTWSKTDSRPDIAYELEGATASAVLGNTITVTFLDQTGTQVSPELDEVVPVSFTFLLLPENITQLVLTLKLEVEGSADQTKSIKLQTIDRSGTKAWIPLAKYKKLTITNLSLPGVEYHITTPYNISYVGHNSFTSNNFVIDSYKLDRSVSPAVKTAEPDIVIEYSPGYAPADTPNEPSSIPETDWMSSSPSWLGGSSGLAKQSADLTYNATISYQSNFSNTTDPIDYVDYQTTRLRANGIVGTREAPIDLSMQRTWSQGGSYERPSGQPVTANCYVVRAAGWYMLPLIYGNAIDYSKNTNISANDRNGGNRTSYYNENYAFGVNLVSSAYTYVKPHILANFEDHVEGSYTGVYRGFGLWEDTDGSAPVLVNNSVEIVEWNEIQNATTSGLDGVKYMRFYIDPSNIRQCNILLALSGTSNGTEYILWSWHIWVTPEDLTPVTLTHSYTKIIDQNTNPPRTQIYTSTNNTMPVPLGWCDGKSAGGLSVKKYDDWGDCWVRVYQRGRKESTMAYFKISHRGDASSSGSVIRSGDCTLYNWGRKDPLVAFSNAGSSGSLLLKNNHCPTERFAETLYNQTRGSRIKVTNPTQYTSSYGDASLATRHPYALTEVRYINNNSEVVNWGRTMGFFWNNGYQNLGDYQGNYAYHKTVYDPCPPDYSVPFVPFNFSADEYPPSSPSSSSAYLGASVVDGMTIYRFKRNPQDTSDGFAIPAARGTGSDGYNGPASQPYAYWTCGSKSVGQAWYVSIQSGRTYPYWVNYQNCLYPIFPGPEVK